MNRIFYYLVLAIGIVAVPARAQQKANTAVDQTVSSIRAQFKKINSLSLTKEQFKYESAGCAEDGKVQYFLDKKEIVKVIESGSIGDGSWTTEYYYQAGKLIFKYDVIVGSSADGQDSKIEHRVYVNDGKVIRYMEDQKIIPADTEATKAITTAGNLLKAYTTKDFAGALCN